jgi:hypothetical protein
MSLPRDFTRWWQQRWWMEEQYSAVYRDSISPEQVDACVLAVSRVFNEAWLKRTKPHRAAYWLVSKGLDPLQFLISMGRDILATQSAPGFPAMVHNLRDPDTYESARLELSIAALMSEEGYRIRMHPKLLNGKASDLSTQHGNEEVYFEIKILRDSEVDEILSDFTDWLGQTVDEVTAQAGITFANNNYVINLDPSLADFFATNSRANSEFHISFAAATKREILNHLQNGDRHFYVPNVGTFRFRPKDVLENSTITHHPVSARFQLNRILRGKLHGITQQLPADRPGIVVFRTPGDLDPCASQQAIRDMLDGLGSDGAHVSAAVILPVAYSFPQRWSRFNGFAVLNPRAKTSATSLRAYESLIAARGVSQERT